MSDFSILLDVAKVRQEDVVREVEMVRINHDLKHNSHRIRKSTSLSKKLRAFLTAMD